jgi:hypothetical protein
MPDWANVYERLKSRIELFGVMVHTERLGSQTTGVFDGLSITTNTAYDLETRCYNIAHSLGHIVQWSLDYARFRSLYDKLNEAKANKAAAPAALERVLGQFRGYEEEASEYAAWLLVETGNAEVLSAFSNFARADIEAIVTFHRDGVAPVWHEFYGAWNDRVACGELAVSTFQPRPIPPFRPISIECQEVIQGR